MKMDLGTDLPEMVRDAVRAELGGRFEELRRFFERRTAELSTEILATLERVDVNETNLCDQLQRMQGELARVMALPVGATRNSGIELEGVVRATESAANTIMTAAEAIRAAVEAGADKAAVLDQVNAIFEACSFQDLTGQRIRRALAHLQAIEGALAQLVELSGAVQVERARPDTIKATAEITGEGPDLSQDEIDRLFA
jgi:chemotaxis protein CheZ